MKNLLLIVAAALGLWACATVPGQVKVTGGTIQGLVLEDMTVYKGIPFAAPPVGELRWKAPQPVVAWRGQQRGLPVPERMDPGQEPEGETPRNGVDLRRRLRGRRHVLL